MCQKDSKVRMVDLLFAVWTSTLSWIPMMGTGASLQSEDASKFKLFLPNQWRLFLSWHSGCT